MSFSYENRYCAWRDSRMLERMLDALHGYARVQSGRPRRRRRPRQESTRFSSHSRAIVRAFDAERCENAHLSSLPVPFYDVEDGIPADSEVAGDPAAASSLSGSAPAKCRITLQAFFGVSCDPPTVDSTPFSPKRAGNLPMNGARELLSTGLEACVEPARAQRSRRQRASCEENSPNCRKSSRRNKGECTIQGNTRSAISPNSSTCRDRTVYRTLSRRKIP